MVITFKDVSFRYIDDNLLNGVNFSITDNDKIGLVGLNGAGKTTLIKLILGDINPQSGQIIKSGNMVINYLPQEPIFPKDKTLLECIYDACTKEHQINEYEAKTALTKLKLNPNDLTNNLSGGQRKRLALAKVMVSYCDFLILDEPTNHLDNDMIAYLEKYLIRFTHGVFMVTHDRYFLERVCNTMMELDNASIYLYKANYSKYLELKSEREEREYKEQKKLKSFLKKELEWINRGVEARRTKQKSRIERFEKLSNTRFKENKEFSFESVKTYLGKNIIEIINGSKSYGDKILFKNFSINVLRTDRLGIIGDNGAGKTTLFKIIMQQESLDEGDLKLGETLKIGYFSQHFDNPNEDQTLYDYIKESSNEIETLDGVVSASGLLERFLFDAHKQHSKIKTLSGGEKRRLQLIKVLSQNPNVLILDEPTNDLDIFTLEILEDYLDSFPGPVLCVSHDRYFLDKVCDKLIYFKNGQINHYNGSFSDLLKEESTEATINKPKETYRNQRTMTSKEKNELYCLENELPNIEQSIEKLKQELNSLTTEYVQMMEINNKIASLEEEYDQKAMRYFELMEKKNS